MKRFIKKLLFRLSKRCLRFLIFFHLFIFLLSFNFVSAADAYQYSNFTELVSDGYVSYTLWNTSGDYVKTGDFYDREQYDDLTFAYNYDDSFSEIFVTVRDSSAILRPVSSYDYLVFDVQIRLGVSLHAYNLNLIKNQFSLEFGGLGFTVNGNDCVTNITQFDGENYTDIILDVHYEGTLPKFSADSNLTAISYRFGNLSTSTVSLRFRGSNGGPITLYVGSKSDAPVFPAYSDSQLNDLENSESELLGQFNFAQSFDSVFGSIRNFFSNFEVSKCFAVLIDMFNVLFGSVPFIRHIVNVSISLGLFGFVFNIASIAMSNSKRSSERPKSSKEG